MRCPENGSTERRGENPIEALTLAVDRATENWSYTVRLLTACRIYIDRT